MSALPSEGFEGFPGLTSPTAASAGPSDFTGAVTFPTDAREGRDRLAESPLSWSGVRENHAMAPTAKKAAAASESGNHRRLVSDFGAVETGSVGDRVEWV